MSIRKLPSRILEPSQNIANIETQIIETQGIKFPGTQVASADPNTLDDYEEGTWTPTIREHFSATSVTYNTQKGWYVKAGRNVTLGAVMDIATHNGNVSPSTIWQINGFPFVGDSTLADAGSFLVYNNSTGSFAGSGRTNPSGYSSIGRIEVPNGNCTLCVTFHLLAE